MKLWQQGFFSFDGPIRGDIAKKKSLTVRGDVAIKKFLVRFESLLSQHALSENKVLKFENEI